MAGLQGRVFGGYRLTGQIGGGGIAEVYHAEPASPGGREAVVKVVHPEFARQPGFIPNFRHIVQMTGKLASHPHILPLLAHGEDNGYLFLITPYVKDGTLRDWLARGGRLNSGDVGPFFHQLGSALGYAHSLGVVHGNLKPNNVYLFEGRHVLLGDFGLLWDIRQLDMDHSGSGAEVVEYLAPEAFSGQVTQQSDIYSLGAVLFATLTGHAPFRGARPADVYAAHATLPTPSLAQANPSLTQGILMLDSVIQRAMAKRPEDRFPSATLMAQTVETVAQQAAAMAPPLQTAQAPQQLAPWGQQPAAAAVGQGAGPFSAPHGMAVGMVGVGGAAVAAGSKMAGAGSLAELQQRNPPFPPLSKPIDERMEQGRFAVVGNDPSAPPTLRMPAPSGQMGPSAGSAAPIDAAYTMRGPAFQPPLNAAGLGAPANPLSIPPATASSGNWSLERGFLGADENMGAAEGFAPQMLPAVRPPQDAMPAQQGQLTWDEEWGGAEHTGGWEENARNHAPDESYWGGEGGFTGEYTDYSGAYTAEGPNAGRDETGYHERMDDRPFSATELGLPRLTNPTLGDLPPSWQELIAEEVPPSPRQFVFEDRRGRASGAVASQASMPFDDSQMWSAVGPDAGEAGMRSFSSSRQMRAMGVASGDLAGDGQYRAAADSERKPRRRRRWIPITLVALILLTLAQLLALPIVRPDLCTIQACVMIEHAAHKVAPGLRFGAAATPTPFTLTPTSGSITVAQGSSAEANFTLTNTTSQPLSWQASASQSWLIPGPASGSLGANSSLPLMLMAKPTTVAPNTYIAQLKVVAGGAALELPVSVTVTAGPKLTVTPTTLSFASCGVAQNLTVQNNGAGTLTYDATPAQASASAMTLVGAKGTLAAGATAHIAVTMNCSAYFGQYAVTIASNSVTGGSLQVAIQYT